MRYLKQSFDDNFIPPHQYLTVRLPVKHSCPSERIKRNHKLRLQNTPSTLDDWTLTNLWRELAYLQFFGLFAFCCNLF